MSAVHAIARHGTAFAMHRLETARTDDQIIAAGAAVLITGVPADIDAVVVRLLSHTYADRCALPSAA